jgi:hypothetical protein
VAAKDLPDLRCTVTAGAAGAQVLEHASCIPADSGTPGVRTVALTRFATKEGLDQLYARAQTLVKDPASQRRAECRPDLPWGGRGRWFKDADLTVTGGRMTCFTGEQPTILWTVTDALVLGQATAASGRDLGTWWARERLLSTPRGTPGGP